MPPNQAQTEWVARVLGVVAPVEANVRDAEQAREIWAGARTIWFRASEQADAQLAVLQKALRDSGDEDYRAVAELGLNAVTGNHKVRLLAAIQDVDRAAGVPDAGKVSALRKLIDGFIAHLATDPHVDAVDTNELGVSVRIAETLIPALEEMDAAVMHWGPNGQLIGE